MIDIKNNTGRKLSAKDIYRLYLIAQDLERTFGGKIKRINVHPKNEEREKVYSITAVFE